MGYQIHQKESPITINTIVSTSLFFYPKSSITFNTIGYITKTIFDYMLYNKHNTYVSNSPSAYEINKALLNSGFEIEGNPMDRKAGSTAKVDL